MENLKITPAALLLSLLASNLFSYFQYPLDSVMVYSGAELTPYELNSINGIIGGQKARLEDIFKKKVGTKPALRFMETVPDFTGGQSVGWKIGGVYRNGEIMMQPYRVLAAHSDVRALLEHEYTHFFTDKAFGKLPRFVIEGLAEYLSAATGAGTVPVSAVNILKWTVADDPAVTEGYIRISRDFIDDLIGSAGRDAFIGMLDDPDLERWTNRYGAFYKNKRGMIRVLLNPRGGTRCRIGFKGTCLAVISSNGVRTNEYTGGLLVEMSEGRVCVDGEAVNSADICFEDGFTLDGRAYRGCLSVMKGGGDLLLVNRLPLEEYLVSVVPSEMPSTNLEALKTQAVLSRTLAWHRVAERRSQPYDVTIFTGDQSYRGRDWETTLSERAVSETEGVAVYCGGKLIYPYYSSTCGGHTALSEDVWGKPLPYLKETECRLPGTSNWLCASSPHFQAWTNSISLEELSALLGRRVESFSAADTNRFGRVKNVRVNGEAVLFDAFKYLVAQKKGWAFLKSNLFTATVDPLSPGRFLISGYGLGHGVGLCQYGAMKLGEIWGYRGIIQFYYTNITFGLVGNGDGIIEE